MRAHLYKIESFLFSKKLNSMRESCRRIASRCGGWNLVRAIANRNWLMTYILFVILVNAQSIIDLINGVLAKGIDFKIPDLPHLKMFFFGFLLLYLSRFLFNQFSEEPIRSHSSLDSFRDNISSHHIP